MNDIKKVIREKGDIDKASRENIKNYPKEKINLPNYDK